MEEPYRYILLVIFTLLCQIVFIYLQQRAKNQADLDVKQKLTSIEEAIKTANALQIDRSKQIFSEEKDSIIVFFAQLNTWIWESLNINIEGYHSSNLEDIPLRILKMQDDYNKVNVAYSKVMLITNDTELIKIGEETIIKAYELQNLRQQFLVKLYSFITCQSQLQTNINRKDFQTMYDNPEGKESIDFNNLCDARSRGEKEMKIVKKEYNELNNDMYESTMKAVNTFKESAQRYLRKESPAN